jgi:hypothetical protein
MITGTKFFTEFNEATSLAPTDIMIAEVNPGGTSETKKIQVENVANSFSGYFLPSGTVYFNIQFFLGDGASAMVSGSTGIGNPFVEVPVNCQIDSWKVYADATGTIAVNIRTGFPPSSPLAGLGQPILTNQRSNSGNATGTASLSQNDVLQAQIATTPTTVKLVTVSLRARKT